MFSKGGGSKKNLVGGEGVENLVGRRYQKKGGGPKIRFDLIKSNPNKSSSDLI